MRDSAELEHFDGIARDFVAAYTGNADALARLNDRFAYTKDLEQLRRMVQERCSKLADDADAAADFSRAEACGLVMVLLAAVAALRPVCSLLLFAAMVRFPLVSLKG